LKIFYKIRKPNNITEIVSGEQVGAFFGARPEKGKGWLLTHIKTGRLVTNAGFTSVNDLIVLVNLIEYVFNEKELLDIETTYKEATGMKKTLIELLNATSQADRLLDQHDVRWISLKVGGYE
jgi:hypothetical protein